MCVVRERVKNGCGSGTEKERERENKNACDGMWVVSWVPFNFFAGFFSTRRRRGKAMQIIARPN